LVDVVVLDDWQDVARLHGPWDRLEGRAAVRFHHGHHDDPGRLIAELQDAEIVVAMRERTPFPADVLSRLPALRLLVTTGRANASIDVDSANALGIIVSHTGSPEAATGELTWGLILAALRNLPSEDERVRRGLWQGTIGGDLAGRTLGVIGLGRLGTRVARVGLAFDMDVVAWSQNLTPERAAEVGARYVSRDELLATADVVTLHLKLSERSRGIIGERELRLMKSTALLVNTSRGPLVDESALLSALDEGRIGCAALDVYDIEPLPADHPLRTSPRVVHTPHLGYATEATYDVFFTEAVEDIEAYLDGTPVRVLS
jgi:phosphoglycerate dehydrogenase-like enzyme